MNVGYIASVRWGEHKSCLRPSMPTAFFTTNDGDIVLRAGPEPESRRDFRVHKFILSLASPVFKDMFAFPQPPNQTSNEQQIPIVDVPETPEVIDMTLRLIYPGVEPPKIAGLSTLSALFSAADKYDIASIYPVLRDTLKASLPRQPFGAYAVACRFGFSEEAKEAAKAGNTQSIIYAGFDEEVRHISTIDLLRWVRFVQKREKEGRSAIVEALDRWNLADWGGNCGHGEGGKDFCFRLEKAVEKAFVENPCVEVKDLFAVLDLVPDPPLGCAPPPDTESGDFYYTAGAREAFGCPVQPMSIRRKLADLADDLRGVNRRTLEEAFGKESG